MAERAVVDEDLRAVVALAGDLQFYRQLADDGGLGVAAHIELEDAIARLPEARR